MDALIKAFEQAQADCESPHVVVLQGETGRGKTFLAQSFFDHLARQSGSYWRAGLAPAWPPASHRAVLNDRKMVTPPRRLRVDGETVPYLWFGVGSSATEGAVQGNPSALVAGMLEELVAAEIAAADRKEAVRREIGELVFDVATEMTPVLGRIRRAVEITQSARSILKKRPDALAQTRQAISDSITEFAKLRKRRKMPATPLVICLDDAHSADSETLYLLSGLFAGGPPGARDQVSQFIPSGRLGAPMPTLIVATVWPHRLEGRAFSDPFLDWLREADRSGYPITHINVDEWNAQNATDLLRSWSGRPSDDQCEAVIAHAADEAGSVNPLVLVECVGLIEDKRIPVGPLELSASDIDGLPTTPVQHIRDRLESLREANSTALWVLEILARFGDRPLQGVVPAIVSSLADDTADHMTSAVLRSLADHRLAAPHSEAATSPDRVPARGARRVKIDADVHRYLAQGEVSAQQHSAAVRAARQVLVGWVSDALVEDIECGSRWFLHEQSRLLGPAATLVDRDENTAGEAGIIADHLLDWDRPLNASGSPKLTAFAVALGADLEGASEDELLRAIDGAAQYGVSVVSKLVSHRLRGAARPGPRVGVALEQLLGAQSHDVVMAIALADLLVAQDRDMEAATVLQGLAPVEPRAAARRFDIIKGHHLPGLDEALEQVRSFSTVDDSAACRWADQLFNQGDIEGALATVDPFVETSRDAYLRRIGYATTRERLAAGLPAKAVSEDTRRKQFPVHEAPRVTRHALHTPSPSEDEGEATATRTKRTRRGGRRNRRGGGTRIVQSGGPVPAAPPVWRSLEPGLINRFNALVSAGDFDLAAHLLLDAPSSIDDRSQPDCAQTATASDQPRVPIGSGTNSKDGPSTRRRRRRGGRRRSPANRRRKALLDAFIAGGEQWTMALADPTATANVASASRRLLLSGRRDDAHQLLVAYLMYEAREETTCEATIPTMRLLE